VKIISLSVLFLLLTGSCNRRMEHATHSRYTCPMHPTVVRDSPGTCPICGMELVKMRPSGTGEMSMAELSQLLRLPNPAVITSIRTITPVRKLMEVTTKANGVITYDTRRLTSIPIRFSGRIEKLSIKYNFEPVRKGQKILEIFSPELVTAQRDLLYLLKSDSRNSLLIEAAREKLLLLGISDVQLAQLVSTGQESYAFALYSPVDGYIVEEARQVASSTPGQSSNPPFTDGAMANGSTSDAMQLSSLLGSNELSTREGMYVNAGQSLFKVVNTDQIWAEFDVYQHDASVIKINDRVMLTMDDSVEPIEETVNFIQPFYKNGGSFVKIRIYLVNKRNKFRIGQLLTASFGAPSGNSLWIPRSAKLDLGSDEITFVKKHNIFLPKSIVTARQSGDWVEVLSGVGLMDSLAYNAQFMVDSESFIKVSN
jgi:membrane fusion protein, copper/silver efflux system